MLALLLSLYNIFLNRSRCRFFLSIIKTSSVLMCHNKLYALMDHVLTNTFLLSGKRYLLSDPYIYILCPALIQDVRPS